MYSTINGKAEQCTTLYTESGGQWVRLSNARVVRIIAMAQGHQERLVGRKVT